MSSQITPVIGPSVVKSVRAGEAEDPKEVSDGLGVGVVVVHGARIREKSLSAMVEGFGFCSGEAIWQK